MLRVSETNQVIVGHYWWFLKRQNVFLICFTSFPTEEETIKQRHNELYSKIPKMQLFRNVFQVLSKEYLLKSRYCLKGLFNKHAWNIKAIFPRGSKKRKSNNDGKHDHGQEKRRPSTLCWGQKKQRKQLNKTVSSLAIKSSRKRWFEWMPNFRKNIDFQKGWMFDNVV